MHCVGGGGRPPSGDHHRSDTFANVRDEHVVTQSPGAEGEAKAGRAGSGGGVGGGDAPSIELAVRASTDRSTPRRWLER